MNKLLLSARLILLLMLCTACATWDGVKEYVPAPVKPILGIEVFDDSYPGSVSLGVQAYNEQNYYQALHELYLPAKKGDKVAQHYFGLMYAKGQGVMQDEIKAQYWLERSAAQDYVDAMLTLATFYQQGVYFKKDIEKAFDWTLDAAKENSTEAQYMIGNAYLVGNLSVDIDYDDAYYWLEKAAKKSHGAAENALAMMLYHGLGIDRDFEDSLLYLKRAVSRNVVAAKYNLARFYLDSETGYYKPEEAAALIEKAASEGYQPAIKNLARFRRELGAYKSTIMLFGLPLSLVNRQDMRIRLKEMGAILVRDNKNVWTDIYNSAALIEDSDRLSITYSLQKDKVAEVKYRFPDLNTPDGIVDLYNRLYKRYGKPSNKSKDFDIDGVYYQWLVKGVTINLAKSWPARDLSINYVISDIYENVRDEQRRDKSGKDLLLPANNVF